MWIWGGGEGNAISKQCHWAWFFYKTIPLSIYDPIISIALAKKSPNPLWVFFLFILQNQICQQVLIFSFTVCLNVHILFISILDLFLKFGSCLLGDLFTFDFCSFQSTCPLPLKNNSDMQVRSTMICIPILSSLPETGNPFFVTSNDIIRFTPYDLFYKAFGNCYSVTQLCPALCDPIDCSTPGFPVLHHLLELTQTHVHWVGDASQPSHPLSSPSPPAFNLSQNAGSFPTTLGLNKNSLPWFMLLVSTTVTQLIAFLIISDAHFPLYFSSRPCISFLITTLTKHKVDWPHIVDGQASLVAQLVKNPPAMLETLVQFLDQEGPLKKGEAIVFQYFWASLMAQMVKNLPAIWETLVQFLGWEDPLEEGMATHFSILAWRIPWTEEPGGLQSMGLRSVRHGWVAECSTVDGQQIFVFPGLSLKL